MPDSFCGTPASLRDEMDGVDTVNAPLAAWVRTLRPRYRVAAVSNAGADLERRLRRFEILDLFEWVVNSHRVQQAKPDPEIYARAAARLRLAPESILFVDDKERNTLAATELGFNTHVYRGLEPLQAALRRCHRSRDRSSAGDATIGATEGDQDARTE
jgi:putative hydrolase of the HAD superfamily